MPINKHLEMISFYGTKNEHLNDLQIIFERAGIAGQYFDLDDTNSIAGNSILVISEKAKFDDYKNLLTKLVGAAEDGSLKNGFIWYPNLKSNQNESIESDISNYLSRNINYSREQFAIRFVEDVIKTLETRTEDTSSSANSNMTIFYNVLDSELAQDPINMLKDLFSINDISVDFTDNSSTIDSLSNHALDAQCTVVLFDKQKEWAELFTQEIWKKIGGVSAGIPILLIGTNSTEKSTLTIPNVTITEAGSDLLALEIKVQYDSLTQK